MKLSLVLFLAERNVDLASWPFAFQHKLSARLALASPTQSDGEQDRFVSTFVRLRTGTLRIWRPLRALGLDS
ncbi:hypothetical protein P170DRAFT_195644 [Aspergillus steynii IBT 23096]|uniref:Uncharacterized protein n=1 Tax=Aspergillus steynii IBT 23096 TaxID=1392250 RepID=A0A2I2G476_9EURO|nr:uncharacterized protein P170DRAFT_195644 [Aspergillus steynii IBT 23096]PLB47684.1 hypothetical protein P170DRAFT_195644 [Aspergillus steynii IBT 23096]